MLTPRSCEASSSAPATVDLPDPERPGKPQHHAAMAVMLFPLLLGHRVGMPDDVFVMRGPLFASQQVAGVPVREMFTDQLVQLQLEGAVL